jgi:hypothetical protein
MTIGYRWTLADNDGDGGVANDVEDVCRALTATLRDTYGQEDPETLARLLTGSWGPLRHTMLTDGTSATQTSGGRWQGSAGPITVELWCL